MSRCEQTLGNFQKEVQSHFHKRLQVDSLLSISKHLQKEFKQHLVSSPQCMLPSFNYTLPTGEERGTYLALEVGGSNLRMALIELCGRDQDEKPIRIRHTLSFPIDTSIRLLQRLAFFDWMANRIGDLITSEGAKMYLDNGSQPLPMGVAWSFPVESVFHSKKGHRMLIFDSQTSIKSGNVLGMGKGFQCSEAVKGHDLGRIINEACQRAVRLIKSHLT